MFAIRRNSQNCLLTRIRFNAESLKSSSKIVATHIKMALDVADRNDIPLHNVPFDHSVAVVSMHQIIIIFKCQIFQHWWAKQNEKKNNWFKSFGTSNIFGIDTNNHRSTIAQSPPRKMAENTFGTSVWAFWSEYLHVWARIQRCINSAER